MNMRAPLRPRPLLFLLPALLLAAPLAAAQEGPAPSAAISGLAAAPNGNLLVSPPPGGPGVVSEIAPDGSLVKTWKFPAAAAFEVVDADPSGRPIGLDAGVGKVWVLTETGEPDWVALDKVKGLDAKAGLAPLVRAAPGGLLGAPSTDGTAVWRIGMDGTATKVALGGAKPGLGDFDIADDGRIAVLDSTTGQLREYSADGAPLFDVPVTAAGAAPNFVCAVVRFAPGGDDAWILEMPAPGTMTPEGLPLSGLQRFDASGKRTLRIDRDEKGKPFGPAAGIAVAKDGVWMADLAGNARKVDARGVAVAKFDAAPPPLGMDWNEKRRLQKVAGSADTATLADAVSALGVVGNKADAEALFERVTKSAPETEPLMTAATAKGTLPPALLAAFYDRTQPGTHGALAAAFKSESAPVRAAAIAVLRDEEIKGFDGELTAATTDKDPDVRASALVVLSTKKWSAATPALVLARLKDDDRRVGLLAAQALASRLPTTVDALVGFALDAKQPTKARDLAGKALILDVPQGGQIPSLPLEKHAPLKKLYASPDPGLKRMGALALLVHGDPAAPGAIDATWASLDADQRRYATVSWPANGGDKGAQALIHVLRKEKDPAMRVAVIRALHRNGGADAKAWLVTAALSATASEADRVTSIELAKRRLSDSQVLALASGLDKSPATVRRAVMALCAERNVGAAAPKIAALAASSDADRPVAFVALYRLGSNAAVPMAVSRLKDGKGGLTELSYLAAVGGLIDAASRDVVAAKTKSGGDEAMMAAEALARSGDAQAVPALVERIKADRYGGVPRDGNLPGALAGTGDAGHAAAKTLLVDANPAAREDAVLALAVMGGDACKDVTAWGGTDKALGVSVPAAFYALAACGSKGAALGFFEKASSSMKPTDPVAPTSTPGVFAALIAQTLRQPDFRGKAEPVLAAVAELPRPVVSAVASALADDLDPAVAGAAMKYVYGALGPGQP